MQQISVGRMWQGPGRLEVFGLWSSYGHHLPATVQKKGGLTLKKLNQPEQYGGFLSHGGTTIAGWFLLGKIPLK